ncbi:GNAT family N-acetyltransferase [Streptomyces sp. MB22_4]|uniref:GNAT family N-acetyltransferase n=1 Tax=Streptomyces sp. MB22_4 TaxID=3383120 RepID=UPI0039A1C31B
MPSLTEIAAAERDALAAPGGLYASHAWLGSVEREPGASVGYLLARARDPLACALPVYDVTVEHNPYYAHRRHLDLLGLDESWALVGARRGYRYEPPAAPDPGPGLDALLAAAPARAEERGKRGLLFPFATSRTARLLWERGAAVALDGADAAVSTGGASFEEYLQRLGSKRRIAIRHEFSAFHAAGYELGLEKLADCYAEAAPLLGQIQRKYGHEAHDDGMRDYLAGQAEALGKYSRVFTARRSGRLVGFSLMHEFSETLYAYAVGFDYAETGKAYEYDALCYYLPIEYMHRQGLRVLHLGMETYQAKPARGARLGPLWSVALPVPSSPLPGRPLADTSEWLHRFGRRALPEGEWQQPWAAPWGASGAGAPGARRGGRARRLRAAARSSWPAPSSACWRPRPLTSPRRSARWSPCRCRCRSGAGGTWSRGSTGCSAA